MANVSKIKLFLATAHELRKRNHDSWLRTVLSRTGLHLLCSLLLCGVFAVVQIYVQTAVWAEQRSDRCQPLSNLMKIDASTTLSVLRITQGLLVSLTSITMEQSFSYIQWTLIADVNGISYHSLLALAPTTSTLGTVMLAFARVSLHTRIWALFRFVDPTTAMSKGQNFKRNSLTLQRMSLVGVAWLSGVVLFLRTSTIIIYDTNSTYNVTAGVGPFNGSYVQPFFDYLQSLAPSYLLETLPYTYYAASYNLVINPIFSTVVQPISCVQNQTSGSRCMSYLLSGGLEMVAPWTISASEDYPIVRISKVPSMQLDFAQDVPSNIFSEEDCDTFGAENTLIGLRLCLVKDQLKHAQFNAENGTFCDTTAAGFLPNITSSISFYKRQATVTAMRSNYSIVGISDLSKPEPVIDMDMTAYRSALRWLLNFTAAGIPPPSSIVESFWGADDQLNGGSATYGLLLQEFQSVLTFPLWLFNANNFGNIALKERPTSAAPEETNLPAEFFTMASLVAPYSKLKFDPMMILLFTALQGLTMVFVWSTLFWIWFKAGVDELPHVSSYPQFDAMFKIEAKGMSETHTQTDWLEAERREAIKLINGVRVYMKDD